MNRPPFEDLAATFLVEDGVAWSGERILRLSGRIIRAVSTESDPTAVIGVCSPSAAFVLAGVLAAWRLDRQPLLLDPTLRSEPASLLVRFPGLAIVTDAAGAMPGRRIIVAESDGAEDDRESNDPVEPSSPVWPEGEKIAVLFFTSGSTGEPKIVAKRADQLFLQMDAELSWLGVPEKLKVHCLAPPFHILGFVYGLFLPLLGRGTTAHAPRALPAQWIANINAGRPDLVVGVPFHFRTLAAHAKSALPPSCYFSSGAPLTPDIDTAFRSRTGQVITQGYGSTETGGIAKRTGFGAWRPFPKLEWRIAPDSGRLTVRSPWQENPAEWHVTDDVAAPEGDGFTILGRADSVIKIGGKRFSADEIVIAVQSIAGVGEAAAIVYERFGENAVALFVTRATGSTVTLVAGDLRDALAARLAPFKVPRRIGVLDEMPRLGSGKIDRQRLSALIPGLGAELEARS